MGYNWTIQKRWFGGFVPIADFVHVVQYPHTAAKAMHADVPSRWRQYVAWATGCLASSLLRLRPPNLAIPPKIPLPSPRLRSLATTNVFLRPVAGHAPDGAGLIVSHIFARCYNKQHPLFDAGKWRFWPSACSAIIPPRLGPSASSEAVTRRSYLGGHQNEAVGWGTGCR